MRRQRGPLLEGEAIKPSTVLPPPRAKGNDANTETEDKTAAKLSYIQYISVGNAVGGCVTMAVMCMCTACTVAKCVNCVQLFVC